MEKRGGIRIASEKQQQEATVRRWQASGLSQRAFCRREGIKEWQLSYWKLQLFRADDARHSHRNNSVPSTFAFAPVTVVEQEVLTTGPVSQPDSKEPGLEVIVFRLPADSSGSIIRAIVDSVVSKC